MIFFKILSFGHASNENIMLLGFNLFKILGRGIID